MLESGVISLADFNPFHSGKPGTYKAPESNYHFSERKNKKQLENLPKNVETFSYEMDEDTYVPVSLKKKKAVQVPEEKVIEKVNPAPIKETLKPIEQPKVSTVVSSTPSGGQIIVGSYSSKQNAQELIQLLASNGISGQIMEKDGKIRVTAGNAAQFKQLEPKLKSLGIAPWVLK